MLFFSTPIQTLYFYFPVSSQPQLWAPFLCPKAVCSKLMRDSTVHLTVFLISFDPTEVDRCQKKKLWQNMPQTTATEHEITHSVWSSKFSQPPSSASIRLCKYKVRKKTQQISKFTYLTLLGHAIKVMMLSRYISIILKQWIALKAHSDWLVKLQITFAIYLRATWEKIASQFASVASEEIIQINYLWCLLSYCFN